MTTPSTTENSRNSETIDDVVVIGGGLVGASLCVGLGQLGLSTTLLEAHPLSSSQQPSFDERTVALTLASQRIFQGLGVWQRIAAHEASPIKAIHVSDRGHIGALRLDHTDVNLEALGHVVANRVLGRSLYAQLETSAAIDIIAPVAVTNIDVTPSQVTVSSDAGAYQARLAVIADGGRSGLAQSVGLTSQSKHYDTSALVTRIKTTRPHQGRAFERFTSDGPLALLPFAEDEYAIAWTLDNDVCDELATMADADFLTALQKAFGRRAGNFTKVAQRHVYPLSLSKLLKPVANRIAVVGNAAHTVHPVAGQGFNLGLRDVAALCECLAQNSLSKSDPGNTAVLTQYSRSRQWDTRAVTNFTDGLLRIFTSEFPATIVGRNMLLSALNLMGPVKRELLRRTMGLRAQPTQLSRARSVRQHTTQADSQAQ